jgi:hypothetical protein
MLEIKITKSKAILVTGREALKGSELWRIPQCLENLLTDDGRVVSLTLQPRLTPERSTGTYFC